MPEHPVCDSLSPFLDWIAAIRNLTQPRAKTKERKGMEKQRSHESAPKKEIPGVDSRHAGRHETLLRRLFFASLINLRH